MFDRIRRIATTAALRALTGNSVPVAYDESSDGLVFKDTDSNVHYLPKSRDTKALAADFTASSADTGTTLTSLTGFSWAVEAGATYRFRMVIPLVTMTVNNGLKLAFKLTTATLTSINLRVRSSTDTDNTGAVSANFATTTDQATWVAQNAVVYTNIVVEGTFVVNAAGSIAVQAAANASHADVLNIKKGAFAMLQRVA
jgi:hypothetical protein